MLTLWRVFIINGWWNISKAFFCIYWEDHIVFIFQFVNVLYHIDLHILKNPCIPGINSTWSWCMILLKCCGFWFANILLRTFGVCSFVILAHNFFWYDICVCFWYQGDARLTEWPWECSSLCNIFKSLRRIGVSYSLSAW